MNAKLCKKLRKEATEATTEQPQGTVYLSRTRNPGTKYVDPRCFCGAYRYMKREMRKAHP